MLREIELVGIVNLTPDSFSDGGNYPSADAALIAIQKMIAEGAQVIDIGAESTRPGAVSVSQEEEWQRLQPVLSRLPYSQGVEFSVDTRHAKTAAAALALGVHWINDVSGFADLAMVGAVRDSSCRLVVMHSLTVPADPQTVFHEDADVVEELVAFGQRRIAALVAQGIARDRLIFDPGVGFGKTAEQSLEIIRCAHKFSSLGVDILIGHSRKSFLKLMGAHDAATRDSATLALSQALMRRGIRYLRVHAVGVHTAMLNELKGEFV